MAGSASWGGNARIAGDELFVVEADEYDQAFLTLHPTVAMVNNVEPDHLECYGSVAALEDAFAEFAGRARVAIFGADDAGAQRVGEPPRRHGPALRLRRPTPTCGSTEVVQQADGTEARLRWRDGREVALRLEVPGVHNLRNAVAALAAVEALGGALEPAAEALAEFQRRRPPVRAPGGAPAE